MGAIDIKHWLWIIDSLRSSWNHLNFLFYASFRVMKKLIKLIIKIHIKITISDIVIIINFIILFNMTWEKEYKLLTNSNSSSSNTVCLVGNLSAKINK